jgi:O-antigen/teichoic acid export membrane protein
VNLRPTTAGSGIRSLGLVRRLGWGVADQGISSLSNFVLGIVVARSLDAERLGAFTIAYVTFSFVLSASRGISTDPLMVRFSGAEPPAWNKAVAAASGTALLNGVLAGTACVVVGLLLPTTVGPGFIALGVGLPGILLQDSYRFAFFSCGKGSRAFVNDLVWGILQVLAVGALLLTDRITVVTSLLVFGGTATLAAAFGYLQSRIAPQPRLVRAWLVDHKALGGRYLVENVSGGARQLRMTAVGLVAGLAAIGQIRAAEILTGPFAVLLAGVSQVSVPEAKQVLSRAPERLRRFCFFLASVQASAAVAWGLFAIVFLPLGLGELLLDGNWKGAQPLLPPVMLTLVLSCFIIGAGAGVRALGASRRSMPTQLTSDFLYLVGGSIGAVVGGAAGSCWGVALSAMVSLCLWWYQLTKALEQHLASEASPALAGTLPGGLVEPD